MLRSLLLVVLIGAASSANGGAQAEKTDNAETLKVLLGRWKVKVGPSHQAEWTFESGGVLLSSQGQPKGKWAIESKNKRVLITWNEKDWDSLSLPLDPKESTGKSSHDPAWRVVAVKDVGGKAKTKLEGQWSFGGTRYKKGRSAESISSKVSPKITIAGDTAEWERFPLVFTKAGKGKVKVDEAREPYSIEIQVGDATYKGIYRLKENKIEKDDSVEEVVTILFSERGAAAPAGFGDGKDTYHPIPKEFSGFGIDLYRPKAKK